ncbi:hypothetical protein BCR44DRAFT_1430297 [Catenaria anguillulae PL171]|uniref:Uncharacterized protein n=1 Tax=Catenaria anguillulae PL171 TaxID=765915 RepID=A0A1Y2HSB3_9FUNG|nr:hypothetical protein BCR44DRAFT_1430297 [Catenaria anguillulae PL171]
MSQHTQQYTPTMTSLPPLPVTPTSASGSAPGSGSAPNLYVRALGDSSLPASPGATDVDRLHSQMMLLHSQMVDYDIDSGMTPVVQPTTLLSSNSPSPPSTRPPPIVTANLPGQTARAPSAPPMTAPTHPELDSHLADDDIDALYHSIRQQKIQSVIIDTPIALALASGGPPPPLPSATPMQSELAVLRKDNAALRDSVAEYKSKLAQLGRDLDDRDRRTPSHQDNEAKYERISDLETAVDQLRADVRARDAEITRLQTQLIETQDQVMDREDQIARLHRDMDRFADTGVQMAKLEKQLEDVMEENDALRAKLSKAKSLGDPRAVGHADVPQIHIHEASPLDGISGIDTSAPPSPSQVKAMERAFQDQLAKEREDWSMQLLDAERAARDADMHRRRLEDELDRVRMQADELERQAKQVRRRSDYRARGSTQEQEVELEALKVHVHHMKGLLQTHMGGPRELAETVTNLSHKLSYWTVMRDVYEETIQELVQLADLDLDDD